MAYTSTRDADATRRRLLDAARSEFARVGIAGARVDRIAAAAQANKAQIYHYFGSKEGLFEAVINRIVSTVVNDVPLDATDLPGYAGRLCDANAQHPEVARLAAWYQLEHGHSDALIQAAVDGNRAKVAAIRAAQEAGTVRTDFSAEVLLGLVINLAALWSYQMPEYLVLTSQLSRDDRREQVVRAVKALLE